MPRTVYKLDPAEKTQHQRRYFEDYEEIESKLIVHPEAKVLKHVDRVTIHEDEWPMFEFEDVMPIGPDGKIANLLFAIRDGHTYSVTGRVVVDPDLKSKCKIPIQSKRLQTPDSCSEHLQRKRLHPSESIVHYAKEA